LLARGSTPLAALTPTRYNLVRLVLVSCASCGKHLIAEAEKRTHS